MLTVLNMTLLETVDSKSDKSRGEDGCWLWTGCKDWAGYGVFSYALKRVSAHRMVWKIANGDIPSGMVIRHKCDNPGCVNPKHLELGTYRDNSLDMIARGRTRHLVNAPKVVVSDGGHSFPSLNRAGEFFKTSGSNILRAIKTGGKCRGLKWRFENPEDSERGSHPGRPVVSEDGQVKFPSIRKMAKFYNADFSAAEQAVTSGFKLAGKRWIFDTQ